jgi:lysophospholipase L1-like esterase
MPYIKQTWVDGEDGETPISAARLGHLEDGIGGAHDAVLQLSTDTTAALTGKAAAVHTHAQSDVVGLAATLSALGTVDSIGDTIVRRDPVGNTVLNALYLNATPTDANGAVRKDYVDAIGTATATASTVVRRDANGWTQLRGVWQMDELGGDLTTIDRTTAPTIGFVKDWVASQIAGLSSGSSSSTTYPSLGKIRAGLAARNTFPFRIVFAGSSTTAGSNATTTANRYVNRLVTMLQAAYPASGGSETTVVNSTTATLGTLSTAGGVHGYNVGESSTTSANYLDATERTNVGNANPRVVVHMIGANDYGANTDPATVKANVLTVVNDLKSKIAGPCVQVIVHSYARPDVTSPTYAWSMYGAALKQIADADPDNVAFLDISEPYRVSGIAGTDALNLIDTDLLHQTDDGHALMADLIWAALGFSQTKTLTVAVTGTTIASDGFNRADSTTLGSTPVGAKAWTNYGTVAPAIISNQLGVNSATSITAVAVDSALTSYTVQATLAAIGTGAANQQGGLAFRVQDSLNFWWLSTRKDATTVGFDLYKNIAGTATRVTTTATGTVAAGAVLKVVVTPTSITAFVNGTQITSSTDTALSTATKAGICFGANGLASRWDDFSVTA